MLVKNTVPVRYNEEKKNLKIKEFQEKLDAMENSNEFSIIDIENRDSKDRSLYVRMHHKNCNNEFHTTTSKFFNSDTATCPECHGELITHSEGYESFRDFIKELMDGNFTENGELIIIRDKKVILAYGEDTQQINGFRKIFISDSDWNEKEDIVKNNLYNILCVNKRERIFSSKCSVDIINDNIKDEFLEKFHIDGKDDSEICLGLVHTGNGYSKHIVAVMSFKIDERGVELSRFATIDEKFVIGAFSVLLNTFKKKYKWDEIYAKPNMNWIDCKRNIYLANGFTYDRKEIFYIRNE